MSTKSKAKLGDFGRAESSEYGGYSELLEGYSEVRDPVYLLIRLSDISDVRGLISDLTDLIKSGI